MEDSNCDFKNMYVRLCDLDIPSKKWLNYSVASDLGLHCLPVTLLGVSRLQWINKGDNCDFLFAAQRAHSKKWFTLKQKDLLQRGANFFILELTHFQKGGKTVLT